MPGFVTDYSNGAVDRIPASYWSDRLNVNSSPPRDKGFWAVTHEGTVTWCNAGADYWSRDEIAGWTDDQEDAEEAAKLLGGA